MKRLIAPSLLAADFTRLGEEIKMINQSQADWIHCDVMDGNFVPNISFGLPVIEQIKKIAEKPVDVHLMISDPDRYLERFKNAGADILTVHYETCPHLHRTVGAIRELGMKAGVALNPHTPVQMLIDIMQDIDLILLMTVNPGFGGQKFIPGSYKRLVTLRQMVNTLSPNTLIEIDGGVNLETGRQLFMAGADVLVAGNFVFTAADPVATIEALKNC
ncbi:MAG TPA: ribulose-phosphate 3-epimerase [Prolixibacteraceae bacterium]|nr:ribulose-phosphate 3-epimerase [Prolixibacteraceae bacterium]